jgi:hypothetical protein
MHYCLRLYILTLICSIWRHKDKLNKTGVRELELRYRYKRF